MEEEWNGRGRNPGRWCRNVLDKVCVSECVATTCQCMRHMWEYRLSEVRKGESQHTFQHPHLRSQTSSYTKKYIGEQLKEPGSMNQAYFLDGFPSSNPDRTRLLGLHYSLLASLLTRPAGRQRRARRQRKGTKVNHRERDEARGREGPPINEHAAEGRRSN